MDQGGVSPGAKSMLAELHHECVHAKQPLHSKCREGETCRLCMSRHLTSAPLAMSSSRGAACCRDKNELLNTTTTVIEYWQDEPRHPIEEARAQFPDCHFHGY